MLHSCAIFDGPLQTRYTDFGRMVIFTKQSINEDMRSNTRQPSTQPSCDNQPPSVEMLNYPALLHVNETTQSRMAQVDSPRHDAPHLAPLHGKTGTDNPLLLLPTLSTVHQSQPDRTTHCGRPREDRFIVLGGDFPLQPLGTLKPSHHEWGEFAERPSA
uniref:Uncharacterized protein n=1 Tax=Mesocestoides corti TaxID=53468 RepID=A0A5K3FGW1_MESCO